MKYKLWYSCYIDLFKKIGVAATFLEKDEKIYIISHYSTDATINKLNLIAATIGLVAIPKGAEVEVLGNSKYVSEVLKQIKKWVAKDEIDIKSHSDILKDLWTAMTEKGQMTTQYWVSRRSDPMLWATSKAAGEFFRDIQEKSAKEGKFHDVLIWEPGAWIEKEKFIICNFKSPLSDLEFEKLIEKERQKKLAEQQPQHYLAPVVKLPTRRI